MILPNGVLRVATQIFRPIFCMLEPGHLKMHIVKGKGNTLNYYDSRVKNDCFGCPLHKAYIYFISMRIRIKVWV